MIKIWEKTRVFARCRKANIATIFGLAALPMGAMLGGSLDYARLLSSQSELQSAIDAATRAYSTAPANAQAIGKNMFDANMRGKGGATASFETKGTTDTGTARMTLDTSFLKMIGFKQMQITRTSSLQKGNNGGHNGGDGSGSVTLTDVTFNGPVTFRGSIIINASGTVAHYEPVTFENWSHATVNGNVTWHGAIRMVGSSQLTLSRGLHIFKNEVQFTGSHQLRGMDVSLYFATPAAKFTGTGSIDMALSAPTRGRYANLLMFESPCDCSPSSFLMTGSAVEAKRGMIYLPCRDMTYVGSSASQFDDVALVLRSLKLTGSFRWALNRPVFLDHVGEAGEGRGLGW